MRLATRRLARSRGREKIRIESPQPTMPIPSSLPPPSARVTPMPVAPLQLETAGCSIVGRRKNNEDALLVRPELGLFAVADGMGGYEGGEIASRAIVDTLAAFVGGVDRDPEHTWPVRERSSLEPLQRVIDAALRMAERDVRSRRFGKLSRMGSTATAALFRDRSVAVGHVGDTRLYRLRDTLEQLTEDHSVAAELERAGVDPASLSPTHLACLTRAIGMESTPELALRTEDVRAGDV